MKIIVENDRERQMIESMCHIALCGGGIKNLKEVNLILNSIETKKVKNEQKT